MKKKITRPDGTIEEYEGTAEEISKIEESPKNESSEKKKKILTDNKKRIGNDLTPFVDEIKKLIETNPISFIANLSMDHEHTSL